jgi:hypothetical protein
MRHKAGIFLSCVLALILAGKFADAEEPSREGDSRSHIDVSVTPLSTSLGVGANQQFSANVTGTTNKGVTWQVNGIVGGDSLVGTIDTNGLYIGPPSVPHTGPVEVTAISNQDPTRSATASVTILNTDPMGTVSKSETIACPDAGIPGGTCYSLDISCPGVADFTTYLKVNIGEDPLHGTVIFGTGTGGSSLYDSAFLYGANAVQDVQEAGYTTVQVSFGAPFTEKFPNGWITGPGGVRRLACRYATTAQWIYQNIHQGGSTAPLCATGNSGGSGLLAYAMTNYGFDSTFSMIEPTSGPPMSRLDYGCECTGGSLPGPCAGQGDIAYCYDASAVSLIDDAYSTPICSGSRGGNTQYQSQLLSDSSGGPGADFGYSRTAVNFVFGGLDTSAAVPQGFDWFNSISTSRGAPTLACVGDAPHEIPDVLDGAQQISNDIINMCKLQP